MLVDKALQKATKQFGAFKKDALGVDNSDEDEVKRHYLWGAWGDGTLKSYNSGVVKLLRFAVVKRIDKTELLPISPAILKQFVVWASKKEVSKATEDESVRASTLKAYIAGIKAWHLFHDREYPHQANEAVKALLKASRTIESQIQQVEKKRPPVLVSDLVILSSPGTGGERVSNAGGSPSGVLGNSKAGRAAVGQPNEVAT